MPSITKPIEPLINAPPRTGQQLGTPLESKHASDDDLELYVLNLLSDQHLDRIEEHLLVCTPCIEAAEQLSEDISVMRIALRRYSASQRLHAIPKSKRLLAGAFALK
jgi:hypothetical protein